MANTRAYPTNPVARLFLLKDVEAASSNRQQHLGAPARDVHTSAISALQAQATCDDWAKVAAWQGTYTLAANGPATDGSYVYSINQTTSAAVNMPSQLLACPDPLRWSSDSGQDTGSSMDDTLSIRNFCGPGTGLFLYTIGMSNTTFAYLPSVQIDTASGTYTFMPFSEFDVTTTEFACMGPPSDGHTQIDTFPATNWPLTFALPGSVGPLTVSNFPF